MAKAQAAAGPHKGFGAYFHWPYCSRICPYCDFNVYKAQGRDPEPLLAAMISDLMAQRTLLPNHPELSSLYFGGGTPSLLSADDIDRLIKASREIFGLKPDAEITLEANPNDILSSSVEGWKTIGINRLSIGVQSLRNDALSFLGRDHSSVTAREALARAASVFDNLSADLIYARPDQSKQDWVKELTELLQMGIEHVSLYELTISPDTAFGRAHKRGTLVPMPEDRQARLYEITDSLMEASGMPAYEVSNYAARVERFGQHNQIYWASGDWLGIGPGAHGRITTEDGRLATLAQRRPLDYISETGFAESELLSDKDVAIEALSMGLRPVSGIARDPIEALLERGLNQQLVDRLMDDGYLLDTDGILALTLRGRLMADHITNLLLSDD